MQEKPDWNNLLEKATFIEICQGHALGGNCGDL